MAVCMNHYGALPGELYRIPQGSLYHKALFCSGTATDIYYVP